MNVLLNAALYQAGWLACTLGAAHGMPWAGPVAAAAIIWWHLARARSAVEELRLISAAAAVGLVFETALLGSGWVSYANTAPGDVAPLWMVSLWALFATTFNVSLRWLRSRPLVAAALGAAGAPAAYYAGAGMGALSLVSPGPALAAISLGWAVATPMLLRASQRFDGYAT